MSGNLYGGESIAEAVRQSMREPAPPLEPEIVELPSSEAAWIENERELLQITSSVLDQLIEALDEERALDAVRRRDVPVPIAQAEKLFRRKLRRAVKDGEVPAFQTGDREKVVYPSDVDRWIRAHRVESRRDRSRRRVEES